MPKRRIRWIRRSGRHWRPSLSVGKKGPAAALKVLDDAPAEIRGNVALRLNRIGILLRQGGDNVKPAILALDADSDKLSDADRGRLWSGLGAALLSLGDQEGAKRFWSKAAEVSPDDLKIRFSLFDLARETGDDAVMSKMVEDFGKRWAKRVREARYAEAARTVALVRKGKSANARRPAGKPLPCKRAKNNRSSPLENCSKKSVRSRANWYEVSRVRGDIDVLEDNVDAAIADYQDWP